MILCLLFDNLVTLFIIVYNSRDIKASTFLGELDRGKKSAVFLMNKIPHIIPFSEV